MMAAYYPNNVTSDHIQQYLDENKSLILKIVESQNTGKLSECAENQGRLQRNLMYLAAIADSQPQPQPQPPPTMQPQYSSTGIMAGGGPYMQHQQAHQTTPQALMAAWSSMAYSPQPFSGLQQQQPLHGPSSVGANNLHMLQPENNPGSNSGLGVFAEFGLRGLGGGISKPDIRSSGSGDGRAGSSGGDGGEARYLKAGDVGN